MRWFGSTVSLLAVVVGVLRTFYVSDLAGALVCGSTYAFLFKKMMSQVSRITSPASLQLAVKSSPICNSQSYYFALRSL